MYFAYGSNMDRAQMDARCPGAALVGIARLPEHRFLINSRGFATVVRDPKRFVEGVVWTLNAEHIRVLDRYEDVKSGLYTRENASVLLAGELHGLSRDYVEEIASWKREVDRT